MSKIQKKWLIVFLIYADFRTTKEDDAETITLTKDMKYSLNLMFESIMEVRLNPDRARLLVILNGINYREKPGDKVVTANKTMLFTIANDNVAGDNEILKAKVIDIHVKRGDNGVAENPLQTPEVLKKILRKHVMPHANEEVMLITWDHGSAFGIFRDTADESKIRTPITENFDGLPYLQLFWTKLETDNTDLADFIKKRTQNAQQYSIEEKSAVYQIRNHAFNSTDSEKLSDEKRPDTILRNLQLVNQNRADQSGRLSSGLSKLSSAKPDINFRGPTDIVVELEQVGVREILRNDELSEVIKHWMNGKHVSVLLMMNCWMMNLHTMFALRDCVDYLVAPVGDISYPGYNYREILEFIYRNKRAGNFAEAIAKKCVRKTVNKRARKRAEKFWDDNVNFIDTWKIAAVDLQKKYNGERIIDRHLSKLKTVIQELQETAKNSEKAVQFFKHLRLFSFDFTHEVSIMVDIINWLDCIDLIEIIRPQGQPYKVSQAVALATRSLINEVKRGSVDTSIVLCMSKGRKLYNDNQPWIAMPTTAYTIFFPQFPCTNKNVQDNVRNDSLLQTGLAEWREFIDTIYPDNGYFH